MRLAEKLKISGVLVLPIQRRMAEKMALAAAKGIQRVYQRR